MVAVDVSPWWVRQKTMQWKWNQPRLPLWLLIFDDEYQQQPQRPSFLMVLGDTHPWKRYFFRSAMAPTGWAHAPP